MDIDRFLREAPVAKRVRLTPRAVIGRGSHSLRDVADIARAGTYAPRQDGAEKYGANAMELEVAGVILARGKLVRRGGRLFFKVAEIAGRREGDSE